MTTRPRVIVSVTATVDGRITLSRDERLLDDAVDRRWKDLWPADADALVARRAAAIGRHRPTVVLEGSGTFVPDDAGPVDLPESDEPDLWSDFVPRRTPRWFAVVDGRGRVPWTFTGDDETSLLILVCRRTPGPYLADLRRRAIPYLVAGEQRVDLAAALVRLREVLGAECVVSEGGGGLNAALLDAGLVDELHVLTIPALVGGQGTPSIVDGAPRQAVTLRSTHVEVGANGSILASYSVSR